MPGIFIGIGGIGGSIVSQVRDELEVKVSLANDTPSAREAADQFRFMLIDTWKDSASASYDASQVFDVPEGKDKFEVDGKIESWWRGEDPSFRNWWPERQLGGRPTGTPLMAGAYASGAGQLRVKGRLAYRIALSGLGRPVVSEVMENLRSINAVLGPATGIRTVPVYLVCSLGGGSGSGMVLTLAQHLRQELPEYCPIVGVFPLASVTERGPGRADRSSIWANTDSALREIDYCQRVAGTPENKLTPFFQWPGHGNVIYGKQRPFEYVYLFGRENQSGQSLASFTDYSRLIAESLIAESFSSLIDEGLQEAILGPHSQFIMQLQARPEIGGRPTTYASAAVASLVFPVDRVERHLARRFAIDVLKKMTDEADDIVSGEVDNFIQVHALSWSGKPPFSNEFEKPVTDPVTRRLKPRPVFGSQVSLATGSRFAKANAAEARGIAEGIEKQLDAFAGKDLESHYRRRGQEIVEAFSGPEGYLRVQVEKWLTEGGPSALGLAFEAVVELRRRLESEWRELNKLYEGSEADGIPGMKKHLADAQVAYANALNGFTKSFGSGVSKILDSKGSNAKKKFVNGPYKTLVDRTAEHQRMLAARQAYRDLTVEVLKLQRVLKDLKDDADQLRSGLERAIETDLGEHGKSGVLDLAVLDDPVLLRHHFQELISEVSRQGVDVTATRVTSPPRDVYDPMILQSTLDDEGFPVEDVERLRTTGVVYETFQRWLNPLFGSSTGSRDLYRAQLENAIVSDGVSRVTRHVRDMSIWDALAAECQARDALDLHDGAVEQAAREIEARRRNAEEAGVPARNWEQLKLQAFIRRRLEQCQKRVRPFWNLNGLMTANYGHPYGFVVLATDRKAYEIAESKHGIKGSLDQIAQLMQAGTPQWMPGQDRIVLYSREGVAPLFYLDTRELKRMRDSSEEKAKDKFLYIDARFENCIDRRIRPHESADSRNCYAMGMGLGLDIIQVDDSLPRNGDMIRVHFDSEVQSFASFSVFHQAVNEHASLAVELRRVVDAAIERKPEEDQAALQQIAQQRVRELMRNAPGDLIDEDDLDVLMCMEDAINTRMVYGQQRVEV
jgi:hypothetical protein